MTLKGPSPGEPSPPRMQVVTHFIVHDSAFLDFGFCILVFLQSLGNVHSLDNVCGMLDRVSASSAAATEAITAAVVSKVVSATLHALLTLTLWNLQLTMLLLPPPLPLPFFLLSL